ncbi:MAG: CofH family radical SAM protein [Candidatus Hydrogenedentes bacterium]|nr:CofH family radical SAM protein [Candidatus Hydrogenedentota bacterium]
MLQAESGLDKAAALHHLKATPLLELGRLAFEAKRARYGDRITYVHNRHVNPTNLCVYSCKFCDYAAKKGDAHAYELTEAQIFRDLEDPSVVEAHIVGGLWPSWRFGRSLDLVRAVRAARPGLWIKAFTAVEIAYFARMERTSTREILARMRDAGVDMVPGGGAEILSDRIHQALYKEKIGPADWLRIHEEAHETGLPSNATMLFGHIETDEEIVDHLFQLRELQDRTGGFQSFIPLAYLPGETRIVPRAVSAPRALRIIAISRLVLDNFDHVKAYWPTLGLETAAAALSFGADDLDGTLGRERIMQCAASESPAALTRQFMEQIIRDGGQLPTPRNGRFELGHAN